MTDLPEDLEAWIAMPPENAELAQYRAEAAAIARALIAERAAHAETADAAAGYATAAQYAFDDVHTRNMELESRLTAAEAEVRRLQEALGVAHDCMAGLPRQLARNLEVMAAALCPRQREPYETLADRISKEWFAPAAPRACEEPAVPPAPAEASEGARGDL